MAAPFVCVLLARGWAADAVQHDADDARPRRSAGQSCRPRKMDERPGDGVESDVGGSTTSAVGRASRRDPVAHERDERMQVVGRLTRSRRLVERLVGREHQRQMTIEQIAERVKPASSRSRPVPAEVRIGYIDARKSAASSPTSAPISASRVSPWRQSVERARPATSATRSSVRPANPRSPQNSDRREPKLLVAVNLAKRL